VRVSTLAASVLGFFMVTLDAVIVTSPYRPSGVTSAAASRLQWVADGYTLMFVGAGCCSGPTGAGGARA